MRQWAVTSSPVLAVGAMRQWRMAAGLTATALIVVVGCTTVTRGSPTADTGDAQHYRSSAAAASSQSAASSSALESTLRESMTAEAVANACELLSSTSVDAVTAINAYVSAVSTHNDADAAAKAQAAVDALNHAADMVDGSLHTALLPQMIEAFQTWVDAARAVSKAIGERDAQPEFNAAVDAFNQANDNALNTCGGSH